MSLIGLLATGAGTGGVVGGAASVPLVLSSAVNIVFDGDSITNDFLASGLDALVKERLDALSARNGATLSINGGLGINGQTWDAMLVNRADLDAAWVDGKTNVLIVAETTNSVFVDGRTAAQTITDAQFYLSSIRATHLWNILLWGTIPRGWGDETGHPGEVAKNTAMATVDAYMAANYVDMGARGYVEVRTGIPQFNHNGSSAASFSAYQSTWNETGPWVHPTDGTFPSGATPGTGKRAIAAKIVDALLTMTIPG